MSQARTEAQPPETVSVTGLIADGVSLVLSHLSLLLFPLVLDLYYLIGWKVTIGPLTSRFESRVADLDNNRQDQAMRALGEVGSWDLSGLLSMFVPSFLAGADRSNLYLPMDRNTVAIDSILVAVLAGALFLVAGCLLYALFGQWLADIALDRERTWTERIHAAPRVTVRVLALVGLVLGVFLIVLGPLGLIWAGGAAFGVDLQALLLPFVVLLVLAILALFYFAPEALMVANVSAPSALRLSATVVRRILAPR